MDINNEKILITGTGGMVGSYVDFGIKLDRKSCDITDSKMVLETFKKYKPEVVVHLAAETDVDKCEQNPEHAYFVNAVGTFNIAMAAKIFGAKMIYVSTLYVFDGAKDDPCIETDIPNPQNVYGKSKYLGELSISGVLDDYCIIRPGWMFGGGPEKDIKFVSKIIKQISNPEIKAVNDKFGSLTFAKDLVERIKQCIREDTRGVIHIINDGFCSRYEIADLIVKITGATTKVTAVDSSYFSLNAPRNSSDRMGSNRGGVMRSWQEALKEYILAQWQ